MLFGSRDIKTLFFKSRRKVFADPWYKILMYRLSEAVCDENNFESDTESESSTKDDEGSEQIPEIIPLLSANLQSVVKKG